MLFVWAPHLPLHPEYMCPSQLLEAIDMLIVLAPVPSPHDPDYVALDTMCEAIKVNAEEAGFSVAAKRGAANYINRGNQVTSPCKFYCEVYLEVLSLQFLLNCRGGFTKIEALQNQSRAITSDLQVIQGCIIGYLCRHVGDLADLMFGDRRCPPVFLNLSVKQICTRRIQMNTKCKKGVYTGWPHPPGGVWIMQWFLWTFLCGEFRRTYQDYPSWDDLLEEPAKGTLPPIPPLLTPDAPLKVEDFIQHVGDHNDRASIPHPKRHNVFQWKGRPVVDKVLTDCRPCFS